MQTSHPRDTRMGKRLLPLNSIAFELPALLRPCALGGRVPLAWTELWSQGQFLGLVVGANENGTPFLIQQKRSRDFYRKTVLLCPAVNMTSAARSGSGVVCNCQVSEGKYTSTLRLEAIDDM